MGTPRHAPDDFVVLVVENNADNARQMKKALEQHLGAKVLVTGSSQAALNALQHHHVDALVLDIHLAAHGEDDTAGLDVLDAVSDLPRNVPIVVATNFAQEAKILRQFVGSGPVCTVIDKSRVGIHRVADALSPVADDLRASKVDIENGRFVLDLLWKRRDRFRRDDDASSRVVPDGRRRQPLRSKGEVARELDRIYRGLFGRARAFDEQGGVAVRFGAIDREGLSAAVTVEGEVTLGKDAEGRLVPGNRCVVKLGPVDEIRQEVERYERFVKYGVRLAQRVELLATKYQDRLGGVAYSFAGGVFGDALVALDQVLRDAEQAPVAAAALECLFAEDNKNWYGVHYGDISPVEYFDRTYRTEFSECFDRLHNSLENTVDRLDALHTEKNGRALTARYSGPSKQRPTATFAVKGAALTVPPENVFGIDEMRQLVPACLTHGDMHGGNVLIEMSNESAGARLASPTLERVCLIDYRSAGPGPRMIDAAALEASIRLADAAAIVQDVGGGRSEDELSNAEFGLAIRKAALRTQAEAKLIREVWRRPADGHPPRTGISRAPWAASTALLLAKIRGTFKDVELDEYLSVAVPAAVRQFGFDIGPVARVRVLAWLSAMYGHLISSGPGVGA